MFCTWVSFRDSRVQYATCITRQSHVLREGEKANYSQKNLKFYMKLMNQITCFSRCEDGVGMEGTGT